MPTYGFRCPEGHEFDRFFKTMSAAPATLACPECGKTGERQLHGGAGLMFKGSGFYLTDYGKNAHRGSKPAGGADGAGAKSDAPKTESPRAESPKPKADSPAPKAESAKPTSKKPKSE
ncbi:MAG TPA: zinc ribbon domain-containing protein [Gemmatimonadaceae bacterium]|nr:zinc ribbon domain-containing protein [Gemmatimonadaceae bacterium]